MKIEDFIHRRHHQHQYQHLTANLSASSDAASAIVLSNLSSSTSFPSSPSSSSLSLSGTKRSSSLSSSGSFLSAINAPSSRKNHKNDETIFSTKMSNENNSIINAATTPIKNGLNGSSQTACITPIISASSSSSSSSLAASAAFNNNNSCATSSSSSSLLSSSSITASSSLSSSGTNIVAAVTDSRVHVSRANPIHSNSSSSQHHQQQQQQQQLNHYHHHNTTNNNNGTTISASGATATTTTAAAAMAISTRHGNSAISRIKNEPVENNGLDYSTFNNNKGGGGSGGGGGIDGEVVGRIQTNSSAAAAAAGTSSDSSSSRSGLGGRLQFFKDGKFILELARAKEGEKSGWISVPRKQFRSPSTTSSTITPTYPKNESSTSLSFSDDNSSIQSSPWQRDHCWKQSTPRRGISKEMSFYFKRTHQQSIVSVEGFKSARIKRRRPLDNSVCKTPFRLAKNGSSIAAEIAVDDSKKVKIENDEKKLVDRENEDDDQNIAMDEEKSSSDDSSTEKEDSVRDTSKTPTPESQSCSSDTVDGASCSPKIAANSESIAIQKTPTTTTKEKENKRIMNGEKRLKSRAKLSTIIQKLLDRLPTGLYHLSKTQIIGGTVSQHSHHQTHSSHQMPSTSTRLASELHYHQQHVSPRKRILREFEKVSLEDSPVVISKRSRAKGNVPASVPLTPIPTGRGVAVPSSNTNTHYIANGNRNEQPTAAATTVVSSANSILSNNTTPTRLYSSYSIHSLLSGSSNSNSSNNNRLKMEHPVNHLNQGSSGGGGYNDPSYLRAMLASPKSPEGCTPNSKSSPYSSSSTTSGSAKKRSPPYSPLSEIHHQHQHPHHHTQYHSRNRSPNVIDYGNMRSPPEAHSNRSYGNHTPSSSSSSRLTPPHGYLTSPKNSGALASNSEGYKNSSPNHHFYSPYMMSPKYVPPPSAMSPNSETYHPKLKGARSPSQQQSLRGGVFRTHSPHASTNQTTRESSPHRMLPSPSPGGPGGNGSGGGMSTSVTTTSTTTPRTVPKKTVSIRRQFASPSSSSPSPGLSEHLKNATANNNNCNSSKVDERTQAMSPITDPRRTPTHDSSAAAAAVAVSKYHQQAAAAAAMMQRSSPLGVSGGGGGAAAASSLYYNMYPPPNGSPSPHHSSSSPSPSPSSSYIPQLNPYYHPYVSTLAALRNPLWMHHYPAAAAAAAAAAGAAAVMMPSASAAGREGVSQMPGVPGVPFFPYNGAAAAAAAAAGSHSAHQMHHSSYAPMHLAAASQLGLQAPPPPPASMNRSPPTTTDDRISTSSIKEEHSSDVPLNLSKH